MAATPIGRMGDPDTDIAPAVVFRLSDAARYMTGSTVVVDGGRCTPGPVTRPGTPVRVAGHWPPVSSPRRDRCHCGSTPTALEATAVVDTLLAQGCLARPPPASTG